MVVVFSACLSHSPHEGEVGAEDEKESENNTEYLPSKQLQTHTAVGEPKFCVCVCEFIAVCVDLVPVGATQIFLGEPIAPVEKVGEARRHNGLHDTTDELNMLIYESFVGCGERREQSAGLGKAIRHHRSFELTKDAVAGGKSV